MTKRLHILAADPPRPRAPGLLAAGWRHAGAALVAGFLLGYVAREAAARVAGAERERVVLVQEFARTLDGVRWVTPSGQAHRLIFRTPEEHQRISRQ